MLSGLMVFFSVVLVWAVWGESLFSVVLMSSFMVMSSSDSLVWKAGLMGELDYMSWSLSLLSFWIFFWAVVGKKTIKKVKSLRGVFCQLIYKAIKYIFSEILRVSFYIFLFGVWGLFDPYFFMVLDWGYQPECAQAGIYMLFSILFGSLPLFFCYYSLVQKKKGVYVHG